MCEGERVAQDSVIVVGGGPHGLLHALALARVGVDVTLLEARPPRPTNSPRAMTFHWSIMRGLDELGVLDEALRRGLIHRTWSINVLGTGERMQIDLGVLADDIEHPFTLHLPQDELADIVTTALLAEPRVTVAWDTRVTGLRQDADGVTVDVEADGAVREYRAAWVVGADGATSSVRRATGLGLPGITWPERFVAVNVRHDFAAQGYDVSAVQLDARDGALVAQIDRDGLWRYTYAENLHLPEESLRERMDEMFRRVLPGGEVPEVETWAAHRMHQRVANTFRVGRVLLLADAAHVTAPTSGYGLAGGFFDSVTLVEALAEVVLHGADHEILDRYSEVRRKVFTGLASPVSSESKQLLWNADGPGRLEEEVERFRWITSSPDRQRQYLLVGRRLESPPLRRRRATSVAGSV